MEPHTEEVRFLLLSRPLDGSAPQGKLGRPSVSGSPELSLSANSALGLRNRAEDLNVLKYVENLGKITFASDKCLIVDVESCVLLNGTRIYWIVDVLKVGPPCPGTQPSSVFCRV